MPNPTPADQSIGANNPPLDGAEQLIATLERTQAELVTRAMELEMAALKLPARPQTDEEAGQIADHVVARRKLKAEAEAARLETSKPYRETVAASNAWFEAIVAPADGAIKDLTRRVGAYNDAKAARLRAEIEARRRAELEAQRAAAEAAAALQREADERQAKAAALQREVAEADTDARRRDAEAQMREHLAEAADAETRAEQLQADAERHEDTAASLERSAAKPAAGVGGAGSAAHGVAAWTFSVTAHTAMLASLGPLGPYFSSDAILVAIRAAIRAGVREGIPGVQIEPESRTVIRQSKSR